MTAPPPTPSAQRHIAAFQLAGFHTLALFPVVAVLVLLHNGKLETALAAVVDLSLFHLLAVRQCKPPPDLKPCFLFLLLERSAATLDVLAVIAAGFFAIVYAAAAGLVDLDLETAALAPKDLSQHHVMTMSHFHSSF